MASSVIAPVAVEYPSSDGKPVAESDFQFTPIAYARAALRDHFRSRSDVYVAANLFIYYQEGNPKAAVAPDVFVVLGAAGHDRDHYRLWLEPKAPDFVLEVTSRSTWREDQGRKRRLYGELGVAEYWQYDPTGDYLEPRLQGLQLVGGSYRRMPERRPAAGGQRMYSAVLGLELRVSEGEFHLHDPVAGKALPSLAERGAALERERRARERAERERQQAEQERQRERHARQAAEARIAALDARLRDRGTAKR